MSLPTFGANYIDLIILLIVGFYIVEGFERGFWILMADLVSFLGAITLALRGYPLASAFLVDNFSLPYSFGNAIGFILIATISQFVIGGLVRRGVSKLPENWWDTWWSRFLSVVPALVDSSILIAAFLLILVSMPISSRIKSDVTDSRIGGFLIANSVRFEKSLAEVFGGAIQDTLTFLTIRPESGERIDLGYKPTKSAVDKEAEQEMIILINEERISQGFQPLILDHSLTQVARAHSQDMWERQFFAHINPDGQDPSDRFQEAGVEFRLAGENLALAPTTGLAHQGLMDSPGHRKNILDPNFTRIGVGVVDGGIYGKMFTQNFAD